MNNAIIGHTGFVGGNLVTQMKFDEFYNTSNIQDIKGRHFSHLVISGVSAVKWLANKEPEKDWESIFNLMTELKNVSAEKVTLISTVDVYGDPVDVTENTVIERQGLHPYGLHRLKFEDFINELFDNVSVLRLPGLFGKGLRKNVIFDYLTDNNIDEIDTRHSFQFYDLKNLATDIEKAHKYSIKLLNLSVEPVTVAEVAQICLGKPRKNEVAKNIIKYDFKSEHYLKWDEVNGYLYSADECLKLLRGFVESYKDE